MHCAARSGSVGAVQALLDRNADIRAVSVDGQTALHYAMEIGHDKVVTLLLDKLDTETINLQEKSGWTVLHHAADRVSSWFVYDLHMLLQCGSQVITLTHVHRLKS